MKLLNLAARVCRTFSEGQSQHLRTVQKVKNDHSRDVVTALDWRLHAVSGQFVAEQLPGCTLLSEEGDNSGWEPQALLAQDWLVVDPLDGSSNHALGLPHYGYMAAHVQSGRLSGAVVVLPEHNQYIVLEGGRSLYAQPLPVIDGRRGPVYYAYPPQQDAPARQARAALLDLIDQESSGLYRSGSACAGLYQLLCGQHLAFIAHGVRLWDALAYLPLLAEQKVTLRYRIEGLSLHLLASRRADLVDSAARILEVQGLRLHSYVPGDVLKVEAP